MLSIEILAIVQQSEQSLDVNRLPYNPTPQYLELRERRALGLIYNHHQG